MLTNSSGFVKRILKIAAVIVALLVVAFGMLRVWWYWPVSVEAKNIVKVTSSQIVEEEVAFCAAFTMTPEQFRAFWKNVRPILTSELHGYAFGSCHFKATEYGKEFIVSAGDVGIVTKGDTSYYYVKKDATNDLSGLD
ncbi:hypothetical protein [Massilia genomosp. 1]|uniref:Integron gene cassette protein n=1 Tax=Massilia genomosp. 1 TaxID=2609280 RepID=A0ABX0MU33_9BURK|nr:hypothetical protein [Massilia genomosp. 1]NHZ63543.1 hypothetical protein [Massilia genomosp. 1]